MKIILEAISQPLFQQALIAGVLVSIACGIIGSLVVVKRMASMAGGLSHAAFGGVGLAYFLNLNPLFGAFIFAVCASLVMSYLYLKQNESMDTTVNIIWSLGMAVGLLFIALTPGYAPDLMSYLFGSILLVGKDYLCILLVLDAFLICIATCFFREIRAVCFDQEFSVVLGVSVKTTVTLLLALIAFSVVMLIQIVGIILTIAMLTLPAAAARNYSSSLGSMILLSGLVSSLVITIGLFLSYYLSAVYAIDLPCGPVIVILTTIVYLCSLLKD